MSKIITVTLNPTLDRTLFTHYMALGYPNRVTRTTRLDPAGRGVNVSRALAALQRPTHALILLGNDAIGRAYRALIEAEDFPVKIIRRHGLTRSNTIILDSGNHTETQLIEEADEHSEDEDDIALVAEALDAILEPDDTVALSGVLPAGVPVEIYARLIEQARAKGAQTVLAADGVAMEIALKSSPDITVLRHTELESVFNYPVRTEEDVIFAARKISQRSGGLVMVSERELNYVVLVGPGDGWIARLPEEEEAVRGGSTSGVHDAVLAGLLAGYDRGSSEDLPDAIKLGLAAGSYTLSQAGNAFGNAEDVQIYLEKTDCNKLEVPQG